MKKLLFTLVTLVFTYSSLFAQEDGVRVAKMAAKALVTFNVDPTNNHAKLEEAKQKINDALQTPEAQVTHYAWQTKGEIYYTIFETDASRMNIDKKATWSGDNDALEAFNAYAYALILAVKNFEKSDALNGLTLVQAGLITMGVYKYEKKEYYKSYESSMAAVKCHDLLVANEKKSLIANSEVADRIYFAGESALFAKKYPEAIAVLEPLSKKGDAKLEVYVSLMKAKLESGDEAGYKAVVADGRKKYPHDMALLSAEINIYLKEEKLDELTISLKTAIGQEPTNESFYLALGDVYNKMQQREREVQHSENEYAYFNLALENYTKVTQLNSRSLDAYYQIGQLFYNKAAFSIQAMNELDNTNQEKYQALNNEVISLFNQALPNFQRAESLNPNDLNTLIALTEIYSRKEDALAIEFQNRLSKVKNGGQNTASYFK